MASEFKIGRIRFTWAGAWTPGTFYNRDAVVSYQGKTYVCLVPNTSDATSFYNDLYYVTQSGASTPYWNLVVDGKTWTGPWTTGTAYSLGNVAVFGGVVYFCNTKHTSTAFASQSSYWTIYTEFSAWHTTWTTGTAYGLNDVVKYGGIVYECIANHTSAATATLGLEANQSAWTVLRSGLEYKGVWSAAGIRYKANDIVKNGPDLWIANAGHTSSGTFDPTKWATWMPGFEYAGTWNSATVYEPGDVVQYGGYTYTSKTINNTNNVPSLDAIDWGIFTQGFNFRNEWTSGSSYKIGDVVRRHGIVYDAVADSTGQDPAGLSIAKVYTAAGSSGTTLVVNSTAGIQAGMNIIGVGFTNGQSVVSVTNSTTLVISAAPDSTPVDLQTLSFVGVNYVYWKIIVPGTFWTKTWVNGTTYTVGDLAVWQNTTYVCIQSHAGSYTTQVNLGVTTISGNRPDIDTTNTYWVIYVPHARKNAMNTIGDIETYNGTTNTYTAVPLGTQQYVLRNTGGTPTWTKINQVASVYYVSSTTGTDRADYGTTWDQPWKTIAYAANYAGAGTQNPNAAYLISANKTWLITEMYQWMIYQKANSISPFSPSSVFDGAKTYRDAGYVIDALVYDITRGGNSQTVATALAYFANSSTSQFVTTTVATEMPYFIAALNKLSALLGNVLGNTTPGTNYQTLTNYTPVVYQTVAPSYVAELNNNATTLLSVIITALTNQSTSAIPSPNAGLTATIFVKTGTYAETLPITVPENVAIVGDELRGVVVQPLVSITTNCTATATTGLFTVTSTAGLTDQMPVQFVDPNINTNLTYSTFGGVTAGTNYYVVGSTLTATKFAVTPSTGTYYGVTATPVVSSGTGATFTVSPASTGKYTVTVSYAGSGYSVNDTIKILGTSVGGATPANDILITIGAVSAGAITNFVSASSTLLTLSAGSGTVAAGTHMTVYAGDCIKDMFRMRNSSGLRNCTLNGLLGTLGAPDTNQIQRPTGGAFVALDPGVGPNDTSAWIFRRSPYIQNVTAFGNGATGLKIDGTLHNGGNKSIVCNDFTHILSDGIGIWCTGPGALTEAVSVFSYYGYAGYFAEAGGRIRATNGNSSYGQYGVIAEGYDVTETPATGIIFNQSSQVQASVQSAFGSNSQLLRMNFANAGSGYTSTTTNLLNFSNNFLGANWATDSNVAFNKNAIALTGLSEAWTMTGGTSGTDGSYIYQNIAIPAAGATYTNVSAVNVTGSGTNATFNITVTATSYIVTVNGGGTGYVTGNQLYVAGGQLGGVNSVNDCIITVASLAGSAILTVASSGTVPTNSALSYTMSVYVKKGTASSVDLYGIFSGSSTVSSSVNFNFNTGVVTASNGVGGLLPVNYGAINQQLSSTDNTAGWYRLWFSAYDTTGLNTQLQFRIYPRGYTGVAGQYTYVYGAQTELSRASYTPSFYLEVISTSKYSAYANFNITGAGTGVVTIGDESRSTSVFQTRVTTDSNGFTGGAGYLTASNNAQGGTPQYVQLSQSDTNTNGNYTGMRVFINSGTGAGQYGYISYYNSSTKNAYVLQESFTPLLVSSTNAAGNVFSIGGTNTTSTLYLNQPVQFIPTYYTTAITSTSLSQTTVTAAVGGTTNTFTVASTTGMFVNMAVTFSGTTFSSVVSGYTYYIYAIVDSTTIQITNQLFGNVWQLNAGTGNMVMNFSSNTSYLQGSTTNMVVNYPIQFTGTALGGLSVGTIYYINDIIDASNFSIASNLVTLSVTATNSSGNVMSVTTTSSMIPLNPIIFSAPVIGGVVDGSKYYIASIVNSTTFTVASSLITVTMTATQIATNLITVSSTTGFIANQPIIFVGTSFGGIINETVYYILAINNGTTFTISQTPGGSAVSLTSASGSMMAKTCPSPVTLTTATGPMVATTTSKKTSLSLATGAMNATFSTSLFGGVVLGTTYYVNTILSGSTFTVSAVQGNGTPITITSKTGSMNIASVGWDHINPGTPIVNALDNSTVYYIEPRTSFTAPVFSQQMATNPVNLAVATSWTSMAYGNNYWIALPTGNATAAGSSDGTVWSAISLPGSVSWSSIAYGNGYWIAVCTGAGLASMSYSTAAISKSNGQGWRTVNLPSATTWNKIVYGNGTFVVIATGTTNAAYSTDYGNTWNTATLPSGATWTGLTYGNGKFVAVSSGGTAAAYTTTGATWVSSTLPASTTWNSVAFGNGLFVAVSNTSSTTAYSTNGINWSSSNIAITADLVAYGQGVFVAVSSVAGSGYTSEDGINWSPQTVTNDGYGAITFGYAATTYNGVFATLAGRNVGSQIFAGTRAKARAVVTSGVITSINSWEAGSNYSLTPTVTFTDPNITTLATVVPRIANGVLGSPTFFNRGTGFSTSSTLVIVNGNGYADQYQTGLTIILNNLTRLPSAGDNLTITGVSQIFKVTSAYAVYNTVVPNLEANVSVSPAITTAQSTAQGTAVAIRSKYSQARLTNHDFLNIGYGDFVNSNYPGYPIGAYVASSQNQTVEVNYGRVFFTSTDQDGNFKVGNLFGVQQATGIVTLSASQFGLTGLSSLKLGGIAVGGSSVVITQFSTDGTFTANSDTIIPTQRAIKSYLASRLSQGGANTFTGQLIAGTVVVGGPNIIRSSVPNGTIGSVVKMVSKVNVNANGVDGNMAALDFFMRGNRR